MRARRRHLAREVVRAVLGEEKLNYLGWSYGTYLGAVYTQMFGDRTGRVVLDSAIDPAVYGPALMRPMGAAMNRSLAHWAAWAASRNATYHLGSTPAQVLGVIAGLEARASRTPIRVGAMTFDGVTLPTQNRPTLYAPVGDPVGAMLAIAHVENLLEVQGTARESRTIALPLQPQPRRHVTGGGLNL